MKKLKYTAKKTSGARTDLSNVKKKINDQKNERINFEPHTEKQHRIFEWLASDLANHLEGNSVGETPSLYAHTEARELLKKEYLDTKRYKVVDRTVERFIAYVDSFNVLSESQKIDLKLAYVRSIQDMMLKKENTFSLSRNLFSKTKMTEFITFSICLMRDHNISFRTPIMEKFKEEEYKKFVYVCLKYKMCEVCGKQGDLHHVDQVGSAGYKNDDGRGRRFTCLCRFHHSEVHADARFYERHKIEGILLTDSMIEMFKKIYTGHFKAYEVPKEKK